MLELKTNPSLLRTLSEVAHRKSSHDEIERQRISFVLSTVKDNKNLTSARVVEVLSKE